MIFFALGIMIIPVYADSADRQCKDIHVLVERPNGKTACLTEKTAERAADWLGWKIIIKIPAYDAVIPDSISQSNNDFAVDFYKQVSDNDENIFFSPISMHMTFSALYEGAKGDTKEQIGNVFGLESDDLLRATDIAATVSSINEDDPHATLNVANALWLFNTINESYVSIIKDVYHADIEVVGSDPARMINAWASEKTNDKIPKIISSDSLVDAVMVLTNAIYFKGTWQTQFDPEYTEESNFWISESKNTTASFMSNEGKFQYARTDDVQIVRLPYEGDRLSMLVILPNERDGINTLEKEITSENIMQWTQQVHSREIFLSLPKFTMTPHYDLIDTLSTLGMTDVFALDLSDLTGIAPGLYVSLATHDAFVQVNEEGTEAAAATATAQYSSSPPTFHADHPFIFIIQDDESGAILFMGRLSDPSVS